MVVAGIPLGRHQFRQCRCHPVYRVVGEVGVGNVPLQACHPECSAQRAAPPVFDDVAGACRARGFADQAQVDFFIAGLQCLHDLERAVALGEEDGDTGRVEQVEGLAGQLLWRIGRESDDGPLTVRVGLASSAAVFSDLPRLRNASEAEIPSAYPLGRGSPTGGTSSSRRKWSGKT